MVQIIDKLLINNFLFYYHYRNLSLMDILNFNKIVNLLIRPQRQLYSPQLLQKFTPKNCIRDDIKLKFGQQYIMLSILYTKKPIDKVVLYLHSNSGSRIQGLQYASKILQKQMALVVFDFCGCGLSSGQFITLGYKQVEHTQRVIAFLQKLNSNVSICVWGRSMGATTALRLNKNKSIKCCVIDSPFSNLEELSINHANKITSIPKFILSIYMVFVNKRIKEVASFDLKQISTLYKGFSAALFLFSKEDHLIPFKQMQQIYQTYKVNKEFSEIFVGHNEKRDVHTINKIINFIVNNINCPKKNDKYLTQQSLSKFMNLSNLPDRKINLSKLRKFQQIAINTPRLTRNNTLHTFNPYNQQRQIKTERSHIQKNNRHFI